MPYQRAADTQNKLHRRPTNNNADCSGNTAMAKTKTPRPASMCHKGRNINYNHTGYGQNAQSTGTPSCVPTNYNRQLRHGISAKPNPRRQSQGHETAIRRNSAAQRITTNIKNIMHTPPPRTNMRTKGRGHELQLHSPHQQICPNRIRHRAYQRIATNHDPGHGGIT